MLFLEGWEFLELIERRTSKYKSMKNPQFIIEWYEELYGYWKPYAQYITKEKALEALKRLKKDSEGERYRLIALEVIA